MNTLLIAYLFVWLGVVFYLIRLGTEQRRLSRALEALRVQMGASRNALQSAAKAKSRHPSRGTGDEAQVLPLRSGYAAVNTPGPRGRQAS